MKSIVRIAIIVLLTSVIAFAHWVSFSGKENEKYSINILETTNTSTTVEILIPGYWSESIKIDGKENYRITLPKTSNHIEVGFPEIPRISESIIVSDNGNMNYEVVQAEYDTTFCEIVLPSRGIIMRTEDPSKIPYKYGDIYNIDTYWPKETFCLSEPFIMRDYRGVTFRLNVFKYNAIRKQLVTCKRIVLRVYEDGISDLSVKRRTRNIINKDFANIYKRFFINFSEKKNNSLAKASYDEIDEIGNMLIIAADDYYDSMIPLRDWRTRSGHKTTLVNCTTAGTTQSAIKSYIQDFYDNNWLIYILLVGEGNQDVPSKSIPYPTHTNLLPPYTTAAADPKYTLLEGGQFDKFPDAFISRISAENVSQVENQVSRILKYETIPVSGNWFEQASGIASNEGHPLTDAQHSDLIRTDLLQYGYDIVDQLHGNCASTGAISTAINSGRSLINYIGHGESDQWGFNAPTIWPLFSTTNTSSLNSNSKLPFIYSVSCMVGNFNSSSITTCLAESWMRSGTGQNPKGGIGFFGSSDPQDMDIPLVAQTESMDLLVSEDKITLGGLCFNGVCKIIETYPENQDHPDWDCGYDVFETWHLFGDAATPLWTKVPSEFSQAYVVDNMTSIDIYSGGVTGATFTTSNTNNGDSFHSSIDDPYGFIDHRQVNTQIRPLYITITKQNYKPYQAITGGTINSDEFWVGNITILDDITISSGNTLTIMEGATLDFENNSSLIIYGKMIAEGTETDKIIFQGKSGSSWGNVRLYGDNNILKYCIFDGGGYNIYFNGSTGNTIDYCESKNGQSAGMKLYNSNANITNSYFHDNDEDGMIINHSSPLLLNNTIEDNNENGVYCIGYSEPDFVKYDQDGYNIIRNNNYDGMIVSYYSDAMLGVCTWQGFGKNSLYSNGLCDLRSYSFSEAYARYNWWGTSNPLSSQFYCDGSSILYRDSHLSSFPSGGSPLSKSIAGNQNIIISESLDNSIATVEEKYKLALHTRHSKRENEAAIGLFKDIINNYPETIYAKKSLLQLYHIYEKNNVTGLKILLNDNKDRDTSFRLKGLAYELLISDYLKDHNYDEAVKLSNEVINLLPDTDSEASILSMLVNLYSNQLCDNESASRYLGILKQKYPDHIFTLIAQEETGVKVHWATMEKALSKEDTGDSYDLDIPNTYELSTAYPNPFNPSTTFEYSLPVQSEVECSIYDLSGNLVKEYSYNQNAGTHRIVWDASDVPSGIYLIRFVAEASDGSETFVDYQKVTLLK